MMMVRRRGRKRRQWLMKPFTTMKMIGTFRKKMNNNSWNSRWAVWRTWVLLSSDTINFVIIKRNLTPLIPVVRSCIFMCWVYKKDLCKSYNRRDKSGYNTNGLGTKSVVVLDWVAQSIWLHVGLSADLCSCQINVTFIKILTECMCSSAQFDDLWS